MARHTLFPLSLALTLLGACETQRAIEQSDALRQQGDIVRSVEVLQAEAKEAPDDVRLRTAQFGKLELLVAQYSREASAALLRGDDAAAIRALETILKYDPSNLGARQEIQSIQAMKQLRPQLERAYALQQSSPVEALNLVRQVIAQKPNYRAALDLRSALTRQLVSADYLSPDLSDAMRKPLSLDFSSQSLSTIFETIARLSGVNFVIDKDVNPSASASMSASRTTAEDALNLLLTTQGLDKKILNANTILIYPRRADKEREYRELAVRTFYLSHGDPKVVGAEIKQVLKPKEVLVDERLNAVIVRDGLDTLSAVEKLVEAIDIAQSEVTIDIQVLEVSLNDERNLGIVYPESIGLSLGNFSNLPGGLAGTPISALRGVNGDNILLDAGSTSARINMLQRSGNTVTLANPRVRVRNREEAQVNIGDKIPVVTTTTANQVTTSSVTYQDVGLQINVKPNISVSDEVNLELNVEMSHITKRIPGSDNVPATFELGSRATKTLLTARNNETQIVSGLIRTADIDEGSGLPWLSQIPWIGKKLFGSNQNTQQKTEIILLLTPRIERNLDLPISQISTFHSGTEARSSTEGMILRDTTEKMILKPTGGDPTPALPAPMQPSDGTWQALPPPPLPSALPDLVPKPAPAPAQASP
ncbi:MULTISPECIES: secretin N-terminal domain-containing protein [unclassified Pseudomonas]|uniref:secretin N-terminal domain-containing protein n=1 Tax=unclassified Pseudomonas TaxID=196821 RepID=UPI000C88DEBB|nr:MULTISPECIES: secretin N-terminal domain-containing protein [unclassified Pseudomonas]PMX07734.1 general secretion pathway protein GspD [Pseudomonas sp. GW460-12]PMX30104.1 general secretion pathway protein GspD [Pseudomonas sp. MPR-R2A7]PMX37291.1 general secretion pathway protein GspD [Pseudomonas sp. MPR-R2A4]PMX45101.1 general secretion pathway protein GspD [Pseudomonas sp. MPR-R2A6]PMX92701.1 general secretion pathway protein GspD [Pseudomonas sp. MPR-R2A3]